MTTPTAPKGFLLSRDSDPSTESAAIGNVPASNHANGITLSGALAWADAGFGILPVARTPDGKKKPLIRDWYNRGTAHVPTIEKWWEQWPYAWIGLLTGYRTGIIGLDVDPRNGGDETLATLPELPVTRTHRTVSGGQHFLFRYSGLLHSCVLGPGLDLKADRGFVVVPPSPGYVKINDVQPVELPRWILDCVSAAQGWEFGNALGGVGTQTNNAHPLEGSKTTVVQTAQGEQIVAVDNPKSWVESLLPFCVSDVRTAEYGKRNSTLNKKAYKLGGYVAGGYLDEETVRHKLTEAALRAGLSRDEIEATLNSGLTSGKSRPIRLEQLRLGEVSEDG